MRVLLLVVVLRVSYSVPAIFPSITIHTLMCSYPYSSISRTLDPSYSRAACIFGHHEPI